MILVDIISKYFICEVQQMDSECITNAFIAWHILTPTLKINRRRKICLWLVKTPLRSCQVMQWPARPSNLPRGRSRTSARWCKWLRTSLARSIMHRPVINSRFVFKTSQPEVAVSLMEVLWSWSLLNSQESRSSRMHWRTSSSCLWWMPREIAQALCRGRSLRPVTNIRAINSKIQAPPTSHTRS